MLIEVNFIEAFRSLFHSKLRSSLALIGIAIGISSVIAMVTVSTIVKNEAIKQFKELGTDILIVEGYPSAHDNKSKTQKALFLADVMALPKSCSLIESIAPVVNLHTEIRVGGNTRDADILGITESFLKINKLQIIEGNFISDLHINKYYCVIGHEIYQELINDPRIKRAMHVRLKLGSQIYTVIGAVGRVSRNRMLNYDVNESLLIPITTGIRLAADFGIQTIVARIKKNSNHISAMEQINTYISTKTRGFTFEVVSAEQLIAQMQKQTKMFTILLIVIGSISLIVGGIGVMNVMLVSVTERRQEIGIRRTVGAKRWDIQLQFLIESIILCLCGGFLGVFLGVIIAKGIATYSKWEFIVSYLAIVAGLVFSTGVGAFFGYYPAYKAARLDPIVALKAE